MALFAFLLGTTWGFAASAPWISIRPATTASEPGISVAEGAFAPVVSHGGSNVVFLSSGNNAVPDDDSHHPYVDLFWLDLATGEPRLVSVRKDGMGGGNGHSGFPNASSNGMVIVFSSDADDLVLSDTNQAADIFLRDLRLDQTFLVSVNNGYTLDGERSLGDGLDRNVAVSGHPMISGDGEIIAYETWATNLTALPDVNGATDVVWRFMPWRTNHLISVNFDGAAASSGDSRIAGLSSDGLRVLFTSTSTNLVPIGSHGRRGVYMRTLPSLQEAAQAETRWISGQASAWHGHAVDFLDPVMNGDGTVVAFKGRAEGLPSLFLAVYDEMTGATTLVATRVSEAHPVSMDATGNRLAYADDVNVFVWDVASQTHLFMTTFAAPVEDTDSVAHSPVLTPDGRHLVFLSSGTNLVAEATFGVFQAYRHDLETGLTILASVGEGGQANRGAMEAVPAIPLPDGSGVVFESLDAELVDGDFNRAPDIFLRDVAEASTRLLSRRSDARPATTGVGLVRSTARALSHEGDRLVFETMDNLWSVADTNVYQDLAMVHLPTAMFRPFVKERQPGEPAFHLMNSMINASGSHVAYEAFQVPGSQRNVFLLDVPGWEAGLAEPKLISEHSNGGEAGRAWVKDISSDGSLVLFESTDNTTGFIDGFPLNVNNTIYLRHTVPPVRVLEVVDIRLDGMGLGNGPSSNAWFTPDDQWVVFQSQANDLVTNLTVQSFIQVFARHLASETTRLVSYQPDGTGFLENAVGATGSGDSRFVVFHSAPGFVGYRHDLDATDPAPFLNDVVCTNCSDLTTSGNGDVIAYLTRPEPGRAVQVYVRDTVSGADTLVSVDMTGAGEGDGDSHSARVSFNGRFVLFASRAANLAVLDGNGTDDIFLRDLLMETTLLLSRSIRDGGTGNNRSAEPIFSGNGQTIVFRSFATDLVPGDYNLTADLFVLNLGAGDSDGDGMDDAWEMTFFDTLDRDGTGDFDMDGQSDRDEHAAGTDPTDADSVFQVLILERVGGGGVVLIWSAIPGKSYQLEFKEGLDEGMWTGLGGEIIATQTTASAVDDTAAGVAHRFYRVRLVE